METKKIQIIRNLYTQDQVDQIYPKHEPIIRTVDRLKSSCYCSTKTVIERLLCYFPIINILRQYQSKYVVRDILAGLSAGFMHLPQGLGFGLLASLQPINGLYSTFYPIILYLIFGTSHHVSLGTNAIMAVLTASIVEREADLLMASRSTGNTSIVNSFTDEEILEYKVGISMAVTFLAGAILLAMGLARLGFLTSYLSVSFIGGFTTATAIHITTSQIGKMLNIGVKPYAGPGKLVKTFVEIFSKIKQTNPADAIISIVSMILLLLVKICINDRLRSRSTIPVPIDLIVVITGTVISYLVDFKSQLNVSVVGSIPTGMPAPRLPNFEAIPRIGMDSFVVAILIFALTISMAKLMARLNKYEVCDNQELVAYGMSNMASSFFMCFPSSISPPRTMVLRALGSKTTLNGISAAVFILIVLLVAGPLFESLPVAVLAAMIVVAMKDLFMQYKNLPRIWKVSKADFVIWMTTNLFSVFLDLDIGIVVGIGVSVLTVIIKNQLANGYTIGKPDAEQIFLDTSYRKSVFDLHPSIKIYTFESQLFFVNVERFKTLLYRNVFKPIAGAQKGESAVKVTATVVSLGAALKSKSKLSGDQGEAIHYLIIDCVYITYIDISGVNMLKQVTEEFMHVGVEVLLARVPKFTLETLERADFFLDFNRSNVFYDILDAVETIDKVQKDFINFKFKVRK